MIEERVQYLYKNGLEWVQTQRDIHRQNANPLPSSDRQQFEAYFSPTILDATRVKWVDCIENPDFFKKLEETGQPLSLDYRKMQGITFIDTILLSKAQCDKSFSLHSLLFHELVHVAQYKALGVNNFIARYVIGLATNDESYRAIPLEDDAYCLQYRYDRHESFSVEIEVARRLQARAAT